MRRLGLLIAVFALGLVIACGGGDDDNGDDGDGGNGGGNNEPSATASSSDSNNNNDDDDGDNDDDGDKGDDDNPGAGSNSDFCSPDEIEAVFDSLDFANLSDMEEQFSQLGDALDDLEDRAPNDIKDDVETLADGLRGLIELLEENDFNFVAIGTSAQNDPRFMALDSDEFNEASDRVSEYCGIDVDSGNGGLSIPGGGGNPGGGGFSVDLPEDFPSELVPPDSEVGAVVDAGFGLTVEFTSEATADEVKAFYEDELGTPTFADSESILWASGTRNVTINGSDGNVTIVIIITG